MKEPTFRIENGRKIYSMECRIDAVRRTAEEPRAMPRDENGVGATHGSPDSDEDAPGPLGLVVKGEAYLAPTVVANASDPATVRMRFRLLSAVDAWPTMGWLGPQLVRYGHEDGAAIRELTGLINGRPRPVPLMWNHSYDMRDKAGRVENAVWEDSEDIPSGVNGDLVVNRQYDPKAALGLESGEIDATSISVFFEMERSHPDMDFEKFLMNQGTTIDGETVAWLPTKAVEVLHHAMVWSGADPNSGPRTEHDNPGQRPGMKMAETTAQSVTNTQTGGGRPMEQNSPLEILAALCRFLGIDVTLVEGAPPPDDLEQRIQDRIAQYKADAKRHQEDNLWLVAELNEIKQRIQEHEAHVKRPDEQGITSSELVARFGPRLELAAHGERYVADLRDGALALFDAAKFNPDRDQTLEERTLRKLIEDCQDIDQLKAWSIEYGRQAGDRLGPVKNMRSSQGEDLPDDTKPPAVRVGRDLDIAESAKRIFGKRSEA